MRNLGFDTFAANLLTIPSQVAQVAGAVTVGLCARRGALLLTSNTPQMLLITFFSEYFNERSGIGALAQLWVLPNFIVLAALPTMTSLWARYAVVTVLLSYPSTHAIQVGWCSRNSNTVRTRTVSASLYNMFVQVGGIIISNIYRENDAPFYRQGNKALVAFCVMNTVIYGLAKLYYVWRNQVRGRE